MPRPNSKNEHPKNLSIAIKKLLQSLEVFKIYIIIALLLSSIGAVFAIVGPNKIKDLTNQISKGLVINSEALTDINENIFSNLNEENLNNKFKNIFTFNLNEDTIYRVLTNSKISNEDKLIFQNFLKENNSVANNFSSLPDSILNEILTTSTIDDIEISKEDKISLIKQLPNLKTEDNSNKLSIITELPESIKKVLFKPFSYNKKTISYEDEIKYLEVISSVGSINEPTKIYSKLDKLPNSIKSAIKPKMNINKIKNISLFLLILYIVSALFNFIQGFIMATVSNTFAKDLRTKISKKINKMPLKYFDTNTTGDILSRITNDVDTIAMSMNQSISSLVGAITLFIGSIIMMFVTNYIMAITAIVSSLFGFIFMSIILSKSQKYFNQRQVALGKLNGHIEEVYSSQIIVKAYNGEKEAIKEFDKLNESVYNCNRKSQFLSGLMMPFMSFIGNFGYVCVCVVGALLVINNKIDFGVIVAFTIYVRLFISPLSQIAQGMTSIQTTLAASERVFEFLDEEEMENEQDKKDYLKIEKAKGKIEFKHVKFGYNKDKTIIKDFNSEVKPGEKIAIVGPTGAGKTTMVNLLMKFYNINSGEILIDGKNINDLTRENIHDLFIMVLQDTWLFNGTIRDNIKYNKENVTDEEIWHALKTVGIDYFVKSLPKGLDYEITDTDSISGGQKQLLTIARGMIKNSPFLILDEATSSVDTRTEELVQRAMDKLTKGRTSFIIAHRLSTIKNADLILVMNEGDIIEQGNHEQLMSKNGFYAELYNSQFKN